MPMSTVTLRDPVISEKTEVEASNGEISVSVLGKVQSKIVRVRNTSDCHKSKRRYMLT